MAADHVGNARYTILDGKFVPAGGPRAESSAADRPGDQKFLVDAMTRMNAGGDSRFAGRVDCEKVGASGMSFGGYTTMAAAEIDPRICCVMPLAAGGPMPIGETRTNRSTPTMVMVGCVPAC
jgi:dienelactone hydrolase